MTRQTGPGLSRTEKFVYDVAGIRRFASCAKDLSAKKHFMIHALWA